MQTKTTGEHPDEREPLDLKEPSTFEGIATSIGSRNLMIIIVTMPLVFVAVVTAAITVFGGKDDADQPARETPAVEVLAEPEPAAPAATPTSISAAPAAINLSPGADVAAMALDGDRLVLRIDGPDGPMVVIYDLAAGRVVQRIPITHRAEN